MKQKKQTLERVFVYGTLRDGHEATHHLNRSALLQAVGGSNFPFPMVQLVDFDLPFVVMGNVIEVDATELERLDRYENVKSGLYRRIKLPVSRIGGQEQEEMWVYVAGPALERPIISSGDWFNR